VVEPESRGHEVTSAGPDQQAMYVPPLETRYRQLTVCLLSSAVLCLGITNCLW